MLTAICLLCLSIQCMSWTLIRATASYHKVSAGSMNEGGHWPFPLSARGAKMFDSMLHKAWWSSLFRLCGARLSGLALATKEAEAFSPPSVFTWKFLYLYSTSMHISLLKWNNTYPELQVAHSIYNTKCFTSSNASIYSACVEFHEEAFCHWTKSGNRGRGNVNTHNRNTWWTWHLTDQNHLSSEVQKLYDVHSVRFYHSHATPIKIVIFFTWYTIRVKFPQIPFSSIFKSIFIPLL